MTDMETVKVTAYPDGRMDSKNAAKYLGKSPKTLDMYRCKGGGPKFIKRGRVFYFIADLDAWLAGNGEKSTSTAQARLQVVR